MVFFLCNHVLCENSVTLASELKKKPYFVYFKNLNTEELVNFSFAVE